jgi:hypothetical protein
MKGMKWIVKTNKRQLEVEAPKRAIAEKIAWKQARKGEEILFIIREDMANFQPLIFPN